MKKPVLAIFLALACASALAQQIYRWTDEKGRVHITDTPPPANAKGVQKARTAATTGGTAESGQLPFELSAAVRDFPVSLYTSPSCKEPCAAARGALNRRAVPFKEVQVWDEESNEALKKLSGATDVPTLLVGRSVHRGFDQEAWDALLDSARYPRAGLLPPRAQAAPGAPEGYVPPAARTETPKAEPVMPAAEEEEAPRGPYAPGAPPQRATQRPVLKK
jgi:glutaredoxin